MVYPRLMDLGSATITAVVYRTTSGKSTDPWSKSEEIDHLVMGRGVRCTWTWDQFRIILINNRPAQLVVVFRKAQNGRIVY